MPVLPILLQAAMHTDPATASHGSMLRQPPPAPPPQPARTPSPLPHPTPADLDPWLDRCAGLSPETGAALSDHLPMALHALHALGAPPDRLAAIFARQAPRVPLRGLPALPIRPAGSWPAHAGQLALFEPLHATFDAWARRDGPAALLASVLPRLLPGVAAVAFHGLIRTGHGVAAGHAGEVVTGLAYWAARSLPLLDAATLAAVPQQLALPDWLAAVQALPAPTPAPQGLIADRMRGWATSPGFAAVAPALAIDDRTLPALARHAAALYAGSGNFTVLHAVTACHALTVLQPWLPAAPRAWQPVAVALAAGLRASGLAAIDRPAPATPDPALPWPLLRHRAIGSDDAHVIKLVQACHALHLRSGDPVFQAAASRAVAGDAPAAAAAVP